MCHDQSDLIVPGARFNFVRFEYGEQVKNAGGEPIFLDPSIDPVVAAKLCDGIVISGGQDIDPAFYGEEQRGVHLVEPTIRTEWEGRLIDACDEVGVSILGVCYGSQLLNVHYGGTLYQDITEIGVANNHGETAAASLQSIRFERDFLSFATGDRPSTAHRHHQAVRELAPGFEIVARAEDGVVEAIAGNGHFGIQWHAESDGTASKLYGAFVAHCAPQVDEEVIPGSRELLPEPL